MNRGADDVLAGSFGWMLEDKVSSEAMGVTQVRYDRTQVVTVEVVRREGTIRYYIHFRSP